jgi:hypothetical protein
MPSAEKLASEKSHGPKIIARWCVLFGLKVTIKSMNKNAKTSFKESELGGETTYCAIPAIRHTVCHRQRSMKSVGSAGNAIEPIGARAARLLLGEDEGTWLLRPTRSVQMRASATAIDGGS